MYDDYDQNDCYEDTAWWGEDCDDNLSDVEADAATLASAGMGTDEDYGMYDDCDDWGQYDDCYE